MLRFIILVFLFQCFCFVPSHGLYLFSREGKPLEFKEWIATNKSVQHQVWIEHKKVNELTFTDKTQVTFVPDSLMQAFALFNFHQDLRAKVQHKVEGVNIDEGYIDDPDIPFKFIDTCWEINELNKHVTEIFDDEQDSMLLDLFPLGKFDEEFIKILDNPTVPSSSTSNNSSSTETNKMPPNQKYAEQYYLNLNYNFDPEEDPNENKELMFQFVLEGKFFVNYCDMINSQKWQLILNDFYPPLKPDDKRPHFINSSLLALTEPRFKESFAEDLRNLMMAINCESQCEQSNQVAVFRGQDELDYTSLRNPNELVSICFSRGYYSGIFIDAHASVSYRSRRHKYYIGFNASKQIFSDYMIIPPLSWYKNLGLGGEFFHPRTTIAEPTLGNERTKQLSIVGVTGIKPVDRLGILVKEGKTEEHYSKVLKMLSSSTVLIENEI